MSWHTYTYMSESFELSSFLHGIRFSTTLSPMFSAQGVISVSFQRNVATSHKIREKDSQYSRFVLRLIPNLMLSDHNSLHLVFHVSESQLESNKVVELCFKKIGSRLSVYIFHQEIGTAHQQARTG